MLLMSQVQLKKSYLIIFIMYQKCSQNSIKFLQFFFIIMAEGDLLGFFYLF